MMTSTRDEILLRMSLQKSASDERTVRRMLGQWVSELEPSIAWHNGEIIGLCLAGDPTGHIVIHAGMDIRPVLREVMRETAR